MLIPIDPKVKGLIFDIDGTLADTMSVHYRAWQEICAKIGFDYPEDVFYELAGIPTVKLIPILNERFGLSFDSSTVEDKENAFLRHVHEIKPIQPVIDVAKKYKGKIPMSCGTGGRRDMAHLTLKAVGLDNFFEIVIASEDVMNHKPAPDTFLMCAEKMGINPTECIVFEDGEL
ncbi:MAG TPA: HAD-IA family hydrolase, partial [Spirochaetota bacterium]